MHMGGHGGQASEGSAFRKPWWALEMVRMSTAAMTPYGKRTNLSGRGWEGKKVR